MCQIMSASSFEDWELQAPSRIVAVFTVYFSGKSPRIYCTAKTEAVSVNTHCFSSSISVWIFCLLLCFWLSCSLTSLKRWVTSRQSSLRLFFFPGGDHGSGGAEVSGSKQDCLLHHGGGGRWEAPDRPSRGIQADVSEHTWMFVYHGHLTNNDVCKIHSLLFILPLHFKTHNCLLGQKTNSIYMEDKTN